MYNFNFFNQNSRYLKNIDIYSLVSGLAMPGLFKKVKFQENEIATFFEVTKSLEGRLDIISAAFYGDPALFWVICAANGIDDLSGKLVEDIECNYTTVKSQSMFVCNDIKLQTGDIVNFKTKRSETNNDPVPEIYIGKNQFGKPYIYYAVSAHENTFRVAVNNYATSSYIGLADEIHGTLFKMKFETYPREGEILAIPSLSAIRKYI